MKPKTRLPVESQILPIWMQAPRKKQFLDLKLTAKKMEEETVIKHLKKIYTEISYSSLWTLRQQTFWNTFKFGWLYKPRHAHLIFRLMILTLFRMHNFCLHKTSVANFRLKSLIMFNSNEFQEWWLRIRIKSITNLLDDSKVVAVFSVPTVRPIWWAVDRFLLEAMLEQCLQLVSTFSLITDKLLLFAIETMTDGFYPKIEVVR